MSKATKIALIVAAVLIVLGGVVGVAGVFISGGALDISFDERERREARFSGEIMRIEAELHSDTLELAVISGDEYVVKYYDNEKQYFTVEQDGDTLRVVRNDVRRKWYESIGISFGRNGPDVYIGVPAAFYGEVELSANSGGISVKGLTLERSLTASVSSGGVSIENVYCSRLTASADSGGINVDEVIVVEDAVLSAKSGAVHADSLRCGGDLTAEAKSGAIRLEECSAENLSLTAKSGAINFEDCSYEKSAVLQSNSGSIRGELPGPMEAYSIRSSTGSGSSNLPEERHGGEKSLIAETGSGSIRIDFDRD